MAVDTLSSQRKTGQGNSGGTPLSGARFVMILGVTAVLFFLGLIPLEAIPEIPVDIDSKPFFIPLVLAALLPTGRPGFAVALGASLGEGLRDMMEGYELDDPIGFVGYAVGFALASYVIGTRARSPLFLTIGAIVAAFVQALFEASSFLLFGTESMGIVIQSTIGNTITHGVIWGAIPLLFLVPALHGRFERFLGFAPKGFEADVPPLQPLVPRHPPDPDALLSAQALQFRYPGETGRALAGVDIDILPFRVTGLIGPSQAGKSTLCKVLAGLAPHVTGGEMTGELQQPATGPEALGIGYVADDAAAMMTRTRGLMEVASALAGSGLSVEEIEYRALDALDAVGISETEARRYIWELPLQKQSLVALVAATVTNPHILIIDELPSHLDKVGKTILRQQIARVTARGGAVLLVDNDTDRQLVHCDHIAIMRDGRIVAMGEAPDILSNAQILEPLGLSPPLELTKMAQPDGSEQDAPLATPLPADDHDPSISTPILELRAIAMDNDDGERVLRDCSLSVAAGRVIGIAGAYGAGKSALARLIAGLARARSGQVIVGGDDITNWSVAQRLDHVATVIHAPHAFFSERTVALEMVRSLRTAGDTGSEDRHRQDALVQRYAAMLDLVDILDADPLALPPGIAKRVQVAAMLTRGAPLLVLDRALANLDPKGVTLMHEALRNYVTTGGTVLLLDHDMDILSEWANQLFFLSDGRLNPAEPQHDALLSQISRFGLDWPHAADIAVQNGRQAMTRAELLAVADGGTA
ncbi:MAG: ATP-binding cassette domain-containing protein [Pseudomonadota bacterium]